VSLDILEVDLNWEFFTIYVCVWWDDLQDSFRQLCNLNSILLCVSV